MRGRGGGQEPGSEGEAFLFAEDSHVDFYNTLFTREDQKILTEYVSKDLQRGFVWKVYGLLTVQLIFTLMIMVPFLVVSEFQEFVRDNPMLVWIPVSVLLFLVCCVSCFPDVSRKFPVNYVFLFSLTVMEALLLGIISAVTHKITVLVAIGVTVGLCMMLTIFAVATTIDFTGWGIFAVAVLIVLTLVAPGALLMNLPWLTTGLLAAGLAVAAFLLILDTQRILCNRHQSFKFGVDEYVLAVLCLYLDIVGIFSYVLQLLGNRD